MTTQDTEIKKIENKAFTAYGAGGQPTVQVVKLSDVKQALTKAKEKERERCAKIASQFSVKKDRTLHPDIKWEDMKESSQIASHSTAQQIAMEIKTPTPKE